MPSEKFAMTKKHTVHSRTESMALKVHFCFLIDCSFAYYIFSGVNVRTSNSVNMANVFAETTTQNSTATLVGASVGDQRLFKLL